MLFGQAAVEQTSKDICMRVARCRYINKHTCCGSLHKMDKSNDAFQASSNGVLADLLLRWSGKYIYIYIIKISLKIDILLHSWASKYICSIRYDANLYFWFWMPRKHMYLRPQNSTRSRPRLLRQFCCLLYRCFLGIPNEKYRLASSSMEHIYFEAQSWSKISIFNKKHKLTYLSLPLSKRTVLGEHGHQLFASSNPEYFAPISLARCPSNSDCSLARTWEKNAQGLSIPLRLVV